ncbi:cell division protein FtsL [Gracilibacillus halophilus YIM-C55.5]|uniref:Cell division protein FtsL n=1 Tax=Gracilibacillus halophilus YIM-C55.5 TaxID=1308866 RepID=N4WVC4_9BACI|nr:cell division protein FtsL [Gracilibacillus halophilus]ENH98335.1 cell division protein FtsL [Gracilibacillus halophilus YIM-C55.5]
MEAEQVRSWQTTSQTAPQRRQSDATEQKVKVKKRWITKGEKLLYSVFAVFVISSLLYIVSYSVSLDQMNRNIQSMETKVDNQMVSNKNLEHKVKELSQPDRIIANAKKHGLEIQNTEVKQASEMKE